MVLYANRIESAVGPSHIESSCDRMIYLLIQSVSLRVSRKLQQTATS